MIYHFNKHEATSHHCSTQEEVDKYATELAGIKERMTAELAMTCRQDEKLEVWAATKNNPLTSAEASQQLQARLKPYDELSEQLVRLHAEHNAIDDAIYHLEKALQRGHPTLSVELLLSKTRELAAKQFLCRAHIRKIEGKVSNALVSHEQKQRNNNMICCALNYDVFVMLLGGNSSICDCSVVEWLTLCHSSGGDEEVKRVTDWSLAAFRLLSLVFTDDNIFSFNFLFAYTSHGTMSVYILH